MATQSYHDLYITTKDIPRTRISNLPFGYEVSCNRVGGWSLWRMSDSRLPTTLIAGEFEGLDKGLRLDVNGIVIIDSLPKET